MIRQLKLSNFRLFDDEVTIRIRPITILIGRNNAGKSSVIKFLLMLQQSRNDSAAEFLTPEGERVKLGSFKSLKNSASKKESLHFEMDVKTSQLPTDILAEPIETMPKRKSEGAYIDGAERRLKPNQRAETYQEPQANFTVVARVPYNRVRVGNLEIKVKSSGGFQGERQKKIRKTSLSFMNGINRIDEILSTKGRLPSEGVSSKKELSKMGKELSKMARELDMYIHLSALIREIENIKHISPTRVSFSRVIELATPPRDSVGQNGEYAILPLQRLMEKPDERVDILSKHLESVVDVENLAFKDRALGPLRLANTMPHLDV